MGTKFGVQGKLLASFALVGLMAVIAAVVGGFAFNQFGATLSEITEDKLPPMFEAQQLATESAEIVAIAPRIVASRTPEDEQIVKDELDQRLADLSLKITALQTTGTAPDIIEVINSNRVLLQGALEQLHAATQQRFAITAEKADKMAKFQDLAKRYGDTLKPILSASETEMSQASALASTLRKDELARFDKTRDDMVAAFLKYNAAIDSRTPVLAIERAGSSAANMIIAATTETEAVRLSIVGVRVRGAYADALALINELENERLKTFYVDLVDQMSALSIGENSIPDLRSKELQAIANAQMFVQQSGEHADAMRTGVTELVDALQRDVDDAATLAFDIQKQGSLVLYGVAIAAILLSLAIYVIYVRGNLLRRLAGLQNTMVTLADGNLDIEVPVRGNDEITAMGRAVEVFKENALKV
ncbi:HAMP domain-containing protein, partial [Thalassospira sp.]|uniref:HAMP domain-containing protein n=1 Tax=Thalassospira sp. TaxID=1912094 RepID=UPI002734CABA